MAILRGYCVTGDVNRRNYLRDYLENDLRSKRPNVTDIEEFIDGSIDEINQKLLTVGYTLPITLASSPYGYWYIVDLNALGAAVRAERMSGDDTLAQAHLDEYNARMEGILDRSVLLTDVAGVPTQGGMTKSGTSELTASGDTKDPFFTREDEF
jgi:hypothetical protein